MPPQRRRPAQKRKETETEAPTLSASDHRRLGEELELFFIDPLVGSGLPLWLPKGASLKRALETYVMEEELSQGYQHVMTPHLGREELYVKSGHLPYYRESMFPTMVVDNPTSPKGLRGTSERFVLKPMNCPHHIRVYQSRPRSYRQLPLRIAEFGTVYRYEKSGQLQGLTRVRGMTMNDAHIFCTEEQLEAEILSVLSLTQRIYQTLGLKDFWIDLALHDQKKKKKYVGRPALWKKSEDALRSALKHANVRFTEVLGEAAFYGPKADIQMKDVAGHTFTVSTIQLDMLLPERLEVTYVSADGTPKHPVIIHRAPIGTTERFVAFLIEHFEGRFPLWLAPVQVRLLPVNQEVLSYAAEAAKAMRTAGLRTEIDDSDETLPKKIRNAEMQKVPVMAVVGKREADTKSVSLRLHGGKDLGVRQVSETVRFLHGHVEKKSLSLA